eukprot:Hpha_TRINITY_DN15315_c0_g1::TRINITY_DN15315_c0_g1_i1::g.91338::m.91338
MVKNGGAPVAPGRQQLGQVSNAVRGVLASPEELAVPIRRPDAPLPKAFRDAAGGLYAAAKALHQTGGEGSAKLYTGSSFDTEQIAAQMRRFSDAVLQDIGSRVQILEQGPQEVPGKAGGAEREVVIVSRPREQSSVAIPSRAELRKAAAQRKDTEVMTTLEETYGQRKRKRQGEAVSGADKELEAALAKKEAELIYEDDGEEESSEESEAPIGTKAAPRKRKRTEKEGGEEDAEGEGDVEME